MKDPAFIWCVQPSFILELNEDGTAVKCIDPTDEQKASDTRYYHTLPDMSGADLSKPCDKDGNLLRGD